MKGSGWVGCGERSGGPFPAVWRGAGTANARATREARAMNLDIITSGVGDWKRNIKKGGRW